jgi:hypothetical protein
MPLGQASGCLEDHRLEVFALPAFSNDGNGSFHADDAGIDLILHIKPGQQAWDYSTSSDTPPPTESGTTRATPPRVRESP